MGQTKVVIRHLQTVLMHVPSGLDLDRKDITVLIDIEIRFGALAPVSPVERLVSLHHELLADILLGERPP